MPKRQPIARTVKLDAYAIVRRAVEEGVRCGWRRARKHTDEPSEEAVCDAIERAVTDALCEVLRFDEGD